MGTKELLLAGSRIRPKYGAGIGKALALDGIRDLTALKEAGLAWARDAGFSFACVLRIRHEPIKETF